MESELRTARSTGPALCCIVGLTLACALGPVAGATSGDRGDVEQLLADGKASEALEQAGRALLASPDEPLLLDLAARCADASGDRDLALWYTQLALEECEEDQSLGELAASLKERVASLDTVETDGQGVREQYDAFTADLFAVAMGCVRSRLYVNAVDLLTRCRGTRFEARAEKELDKLYGNSRAATALLQYGMDITPPAPSPEKARLLAARDAKHSTWENAYEKKTTNYNVKSNMNYELVEKISKAMEQMSKRYRKVFNFKGRTTRCSISVYRTRKDFDQYERVRSPGIRGFYVPSQNRVATYDIRSEGGSLAGLWSTLFHEASHQFTKEISKGLIPGWLNEGTASYFEGARLMPNGTVVVNGIPRSRLDNLEKVLSSGSPSVETVISYYAPGSYPGSYYPVGWGLVYFIHNYENEKCERVYIPHYQSYLNAYRKGDKHNPVDRFKEYFVKRPREEGIETLDDLVKRFEDWIMALHKDYFGPPEQADNWLDKARRRLDYGMKEEALEAYRYALEKRPDHIATLLEIADLQVKLKMKDPAILNLRRALELARKLPPNEEVEIQGPVASAVVEDCLERLNRLDRNLAQGLRRATGDFVQTCEEAARAYAEAGLPRASLRLLDDAVSLMAGDRVLEKLRHTIADTSGVDVRRWRQLPLEEELAASEDSHGWELRDATVRRLKDSVTPLIFGGEMPRSYTLQATMFLPAEKAGGFTFGDSDRGQNLFGAFRDKLMAFCIDYQDDGPSDNEDLGEMDPMGGEFVLGLEVDGDRVTYLRDGEVLAERTYRPAVTRGKIGLFAQDGVVFKDVKVRY